VDIFVKWNLLLHYWKMRRVNLPNCPELEKKALRLILHLLKQDRAAVEAFGEAVLKIRREIKFCQRCFNVVKCNK
jgi:recombinational DNA repair protein RecR